MANGEGALGAETMGEIERRAPYVVIVSLIRFFVPLLDIEQFSAKVPCLKSGSQRS